MSLVAVNCISNAVCVAVRAIITISGMLVGLGVLVCVGVEVGNGVEVLVGSVSPKLLMTLLPLIVVVDGEMVLII